MQPEQLARHPHPGFIRVGDRRGFQGLAHGRHGGRDPCSGFFIDRQYRGIRHRQPEQIVRQRASTRHRHHVVMRQMHHGGLNVRSVLHRCRHRRGKRTSMHFAACATRFEHLVLSHFMAQRRNVEYLARLDHDRIGQRLMADIAMARRQVWLNVVRMRYLLQRLARVPFLATRRPHPFLALRFWLRPAQTVRRRRLAGILAVQGQTSFKFRHLRSQQRHLRSLQPYLRVQRTDQVVFIGNAESVKVGQGFHEPDYQLQQPFTTH